jgi:hypothetical protein
MFFVNNTIRLPGNPHGQGCRTVSFIQEIRSRSFFVILKFACDICMQIKPYESISANQHGIWSTKLYLRPRVISKALQIRNFESASLLVVKMSHFVTHLKLRILLLLDQFKRFFPETLACEADGHSCFGHQSSIYLPTTLVSNSSSQCLPVAASFLVRRVSSEGSTYSTHTRSQRPWSKTRSSLSTC